MTPKGVVALLSTSINAQQSAGEINCSQTCPASSGQLSDYSQICTAHTASCHTVSDMYPPKRTCVGLFKSVFLSVVSCRSVHRHVPATEKAVGLFPDLHPSHWLAVRLSPTSPYPKAGDVAKSLTLLNKMNRKSYVDELMA